MAALVNTCSKKDFSVDTGVGADFDMGMGMDMDDMFVVVVVVGCIVVRAPGVLACMAARL